MTHTNKQHATDRPTSRDASHLKIAKGGRIFRVVSHPQREGIDFHTIYFYFGFLLPLVLRLFPFYHFASVGFILPTF